MCEVSSLIFMEGKAEGEHRKACESALAMLEDDLPHGTIARYTGLTVEEVNQLAQKQPA